MQQIKCATGDFYSASRCLCRILTLSSKEYKSKPQLKFLIPLIIGLIQGCVYVPRTTVAYDEECRIYTKQMVLDVVQVGAIGRCVNEGCVVAIVAASAVTAASVVVSGSIAVVGNVVYWLEKKGQCF